MADQRFQNVINGELVDSASGETYDVIDPTTGEVYATAPMSSVEDVDRAYGAAAQAFETWGDSTPQDRAAAMLKIAGRRLRRLAFDEWRAMPALVDHAQSLISRDG